MNHQNSTRLRGWAALVVGCIAAVTLLLLAWSIATATPTDDPIVQSHFNDDGLDGWIININGPFENPGSGGADGGAGDGYLLSVPPSDGRTSYFVAPELFLGNWLEKEIVLISLDILWDGEDGVRYYTTGEYGSRGDVIISGPGGFARHTWDAPSQSNWTNQRISLLNDSNWQMGGGATTVADILEEVTALEIRAEYGVGEDEAGLDNVTLWGPVPQFTPREGVTEIDGQAVQQTTPLQGGETIGFRLSGEGALFCASGLGVEASFGMAEIFETFLSGDEDDLAELSGAWREICKPVIESLSQPERRPALESALQLEDQLLLLRPVDMAVLVQSGDVIAQIDPNESAIVAYDPDTGRSGIAAVSGPISVAFENANSAPFTVDQGTAVTIAEGGVSAPDAIPQLFLPLVR